MIEASCDCGGVRIEIDAAPQSVTDCNCGICRRYGALWAYYMPPQVRVAGATTIYLRGDKRLEFHHCVTCRCLTHWEAVDKSAQRMGVNARLMPPDVLKAARLEFCDAASW